MSLANKITVFRIILIPVFVAFLLSRLEHGDWIAAGVFAVAALTDSIDGYLARKHNQITVFGKLFDPLADKLLVSAALIILVGLGRLSAWLAMIIITREFVVSGLRFLALANGAVIAASPMGKIKTVSQVIAVIAWILKPAPVSDLTAAILMGIAVFFTVVSGVDYYFKVKAGLEEVKRRPAEAGPADGNRG